MPRLTGRAGLAATVLALVLTAQDGTGPPAPPPPTPTTAPAPDPPTPARPPTPPTPTPPAPAPAPPTAAPDPPADVPPLAGQGPSAPVPYEFRVVDLPLRGALTQLDAWGKAGWQLCDTVQFSEETLGGDGFLRTTLKIRFWLQRPIPTAVPAAAGP